MKFVLCFADIRWMNAAHNFLILCYIWKHKAWLTETGSSYNPNQNFPTTKVLALELSLLLQQNSIRRPLFQWHFCIFHTLIISNTLSHYLITSQLVLSLNSLIWLCEIQSYLSWRYYPPHFTEPAPRGFQPLRFFLMHNIFSNQYPEQYYPWYHTESSWSKIIWHNIFLYRKMSAHLNILLKHINFHGISLKVGKHTAKII